MKRILMITLVMFLVALNAAAQNTAFSYQGKLNVSGAPANANFDFEFRLFDAVTDGTQIGPLEPRNNVAVADGIFTVTLDFGGNFPGAGRFLAISVRPIGGAFTPLTPRQPITSSPYSIQTMNSQMLGGVPASQYVQTGDPRLSDARPPTPGSPNYVQNTITPQAASNFNVTGSGTADSLTANSTISVTGSAKPATAPVGQGRLYFDSLTNKLRVSENGDPFVDLVGATGVAGSGTPDTIPFWSGGTTLGNSQITQSVAGVQLPTNVQLAPGGAQGNRVQFGTPNSETGMTISGATGRADLRYDGTTLKLFNGPAGSPPSGGIAIAQSGSINITPSSNNAGTNSFTMTAADTRMELFATENTGRALTRYQTLTGAWLVGADFSNFIIDSFSNPSQNFVVTSNGSVGINIDAPQRLLHVNGRARIASIPSEANVGQVCFNAAGDLLNCAGSSLRWKTNVQSFSDGLNVLRQLRPISYNWKEGGAYDIGLGAEDVAKVAPFFAVRNKEGVVEGVRYERLNMLLINAVKEQQQIIERQNAKIDALMKLVCASNKDADICKEK